MKRIVKIMSVAVIFFAVLLAGTNIYANSSVTSTEILTEIAREMKIKVVNVNGWDYVLYYLDTAKITDKYADRVSFSEGEYMEITVDGVTYEINRKESLAGSVRYGSR